MKITFYSSTGETLRELGRRIKTARIAASVSQKEMAERMHVSAHTVSNLENGKDATLSTLVETLRVLGRLQALDALLPEEPVQPEQIYAIGKPRQRVFRRTKRKQQPERRKWGDET